MTRECSAHAEYGKNYEVLLLAFGQMPNGWSSCWVKFPTLQSKTPVKSLWYDQGGWVVLELTGTL